MDTQPIIDAVRNLAEPKIIGQEGINPDLALAFVPEGRKIFDLQPYLDKLRDAPRRIETAAKASTVDSFIAYLKRFKTPDSAVFADDDPAKPLMLGILDFHGQGSAAEPRFGVHRIVYEFPVSDQIRAWSAISGKELPHEAMSAFINDRQYDIANPPLDWMQVDPGTIKLLLHLLNINDDHGNIEEAALDNPGAGMTARDHRSATVEQDNTEADDRYIPRSALYKLRQIRFGTSARMIQLARTVELSINSVATEGYNSKTGERTIVFKDEHETRDKDGRRVIVPDAFLLRAPVWEGETAQLIPVRVQYRRSSGSLRWFLTLVEWRRVVRHAVKTEAERVADAASLPVFFGRPTS